MKLEKNVLGVITTAHNFVKKTLTEAGELRLTQAVDVEFYLGLNGPDNYTYKFHIYNFFVHPEFIRHYTTPS